MALNLVPISGNTFPVKDQLKALGARWNAADKAWMINPAKADEARAIVKGAGAKTFRCETSPAPRRGCITCGKTPRYDRRGYAEAGSKLLRSGECVDCYEERRSGY